MYTIQYGKNKNENWKLYNEADEYDYWFHINDYPSTHVYVQCINDITEDLITKACLLCIEKTPKVKNLSNKKIKIIYTIKSNLKKGRCIGEIEIIDESLCNYRIIQIN